MRKIEIFIVKPPIGWLYEENNHENKIA